MDGIPIIGFRHCVEIFYLFLCFRRKTSSEFEITEEATSEEIVNRVRKIVSNFRSIAKYVKNSPKAKERYKLSTQCRNPIIGIPSMYLWTSEFDGIQHFNASEPT